MTMRILYLSQYFPPETGATQTRAFEMARSFVRAGHPVTMLAEIPNHPSGVIPPTYRGKLYQRSALEGIDVIYVWVKASPNKSFRSRIIFYLSYMLTAALAGILLARGAYDLIYCSSPPLFAGAAGLALAFLKRKPLVFEVRDLWPESAIALDELSNPRWIRWAEALENACYRRSRKIVVVTRGIHNRLLERGIPAEKLVFIPNGANLDEFQFQADQRSGWREELGWQDKFVAIYAGIFGLAQGLETIVKTAELLRDSLSIRFLLVGEGPKKEEITNLAARLNLDNLQILPEQPRSAMPGLLSAADVAMIPLRRLELFKGALPSKMFDAWACSRPIVISIDGEARELVNHAEGGLYVPPEDPWALAKALLQLHADQELCTRMGSNGRAYTAAHYSRPVLAEQLMKILETTIN
jgi:colanic acid biosynthesis glycosyl transferase WcaI